MGDFVGFRGGECGRFWAMIAAIVFGGDCFRARGGRFRVRGAEGKKKKVHPTRKMQSDEPKIENMDGCLTKSEHGVGASSALVLRLCRGTAARRGIVVWTMAEERQRATARWWFSVGKGEG